MVRLPLMIHYAVTWRCWGLGLLIDWKDIHIEGIVGPFSFRFLL